jgi:hypothetical protein
MADAEEDNRRRLNPRDNVGVHRPRIYVIVVGANCGNERGLPAQPVFLLITLDGGRFPRLRLLHNGIHLHVGESEADLVEGRSDIARAASRLRRANRRRREKNRNKRKSDCTQANEHPQPTPPGIPSSLNEPFYSITPGSHEAGRQRKTAGNQRGFH